MLENIVIATCDGCGKTVTQKGLWTYLSGKRYGWIEIRANTVDQRDLFACSKECAHKVIDTANYRTESVLESD